MQIPPWWHPTLGAVGGLHREGLHTALWLDGGRETWRENLWHDIQSPQQSNEN